MKLHIGCGTRKLPGFVNIDLEGEADRLMDVRNGLPYRTGSVDAIFSEHFVEHLTREEAAEFFRECHRVLKPGGACRVATPDLKDLVESYSRKTWKKKEWIDRFGYGWIPNRCVMMNLSMREWGHKHVFDFEDLKMVGNLAGFPLVNRRALRRSTFPELRGLEDRDDSIVVEMEKGGEGNLGRLPLVSILIPAYGARYFERALKSALRQTWPRTEIVICNDHPGSDIGKIIRKFAGDRRIRYRQNRKNLGATANYEKCYSLARGSYIKFLNDDDILEPACVEKMVCGLEAFGDRVGLVTSSRVPIDSRGRILEDSLATQPMAGRDVVFRGRDLGNFLLRHIVNTIGEPTSPMFRKKDLRAGKKGLFSILGKRIPWNVDVVMWLKLLAKKDALYLSEPLSRIRVHPQQQQQQPEVIAACLDSWGDLVRQGVRLGFLENAGSRAQAVDTLHRNFDHFYTHPGLSPDDRRRILEIRKKLQTWCAKTGVARGRGRPYRTLSEEIGKIRDNPVWAPPVRSRALLVS